MIWERGIVLVVWFTFIVSVLLFALCELSHLFGAPVLTWDMHDKANIHFAIAWVSWIEIRLWKMRK